MLRVNNVFFLTVFFRSNILKIGDEDNEVG